MNSSISPFKLKSFQNSKYFKFFNFSFFALLSFKFSTLITNPFSINQTCIIFLQDLLQCFNPGQDSINIESVQTLGRDSTSCFIVPFRPEISHCFESLAEWNYFQVVSPGVIIFNGVNSLSVSKLARAGIRNAV